MMASAHVDATVPNFLIQETMTDQLETFKELVPGYTYDPQYLDLPDAPGLGLDISDEWVKDHMVT